MSKHLAIRALVMLSMLTTSPLLAQADSGNANPGVLPPHARAFAATYAQWAARWWTWAYSIPADQSPIVADEADCTLNQGGHVWFLSGRPGGITRDCTTPAGMPIFFPLVNVFNDYPCPDPNYQPAPGQTLEAFLTEGARVLIDFTTELEATLDGVPLQNLFDYRATSRLFTFTGRSPATRVSPASSTPASPARRRSESPTATG
jgi:hypothetical protein